MKFSFFIFQILRRMKWNSGTRIKRYSLLKPDSEFICLDIKVYNSENFNRESTLDIQTYHEETETFKYLNFHPFVTKEKDFVRGEAQCPLGKESSCSTFHKNI